MSAPVLAATDPALALVLEAARMSPVEYDRERQRIAERLGVRVSALDAEVREYQRAEKATRPALTAESKAKPAPQGSAITFADPEPWPESVNGASLLDELAATFTGFLALPPHAAEALALWVLHSHAHAAAEISPILAITSPVPGCGKTSLLHILGALAPKPLHAANVTAAALFRAVERLRPTLLVDEADSFLDDRDELRGILNSGHARRSAVIVRTVGDDFEARTFSTWAPKAIARIGRLPATLADRSIEVAMRRRTREEKVERLRLDRLDALEPLRRRAWTWARANLERLRAADPDVPEALRDRAADNWRPLVAIADLAGSAWPERARKAALALSGIPADDDQPAGVLLLADLAALFEERGADALGSEEIVRHLATLDDKPWPEWSRGNPISKRGLARLLAPFGVQPRVLWIGDRSARGYRREDLADALSRYIPPAQVSEPKGSRIGAANPDFEKCKAAPDLTDAKSRENRAVTPTLRSLRLEQEGGEL